MTTDNTTSFDTSITTGMETQLTIDFSGGNPQTSEAPLQPLASPSRELFTGEARENLRSGTWEERQAKAAAVTEGALTRLGESLAAGHSESLTNFLSTMGRFHSYSLSNVLLIAFQNPTATRVAGFHAWKDLGRTVKKGESGIMVMAPVTRKVGESREVGEDGTLTTKDIRKVVNVKPVYVFDVSQTEGKELPRVYVTQGEPAQNTERLKAHIRSLGIEIQYAANLGGALGQSAGKIIRVLDSATQAQEFRILAHELAHEVMHQGKSREEIPKKTRELEAEAVAFVVCSAVGIDTERSSTDYIHLYRGSREALTESLQRIRTTACSLVNVILEED